MATEFCYCFLMSRPVRPPLGRHLAGVSRAVSRAFDEVLAEAGQAALLEWPGVDLAALRAAA